MLRRAPDLQLVEEFELPCQHLNNNRESELWQVLDEEDKSASNKVEPREFCLGDAVDDGPRSARVPRA